MSRWGVVFDQAKCIGCNACQVACKDYHSLESGKNFRRAETVEYEEDGVKKYAHFSGSCHHCVDAACVKACAFGAMKVTDEGIVVVDEALCRGCGACERACQYGAVYVSARRYVAMKCDTCMARRQSGEQPVCVEACRTFALEFKELGEEKEENPVAAMIGETFCVNLKADAKKSAACGNSVAAGTGKAGVAAEVSEAKEAGWDDPAKMEEELAKNLKQLAAFFETREQAMEICRGFADWEKKSEREWKLEYDFLFRGTDADWLIPLWASVAFGEQVLLDRTTLNVIHNYHKYGYEPVRMEGNPPDYIGEQLLFAAKLMEIGNKNAVCNFIKTYTKPTAEMVCEHVKKRGTFEGIIMYLDWMLEVLAKCVKIADQEEKEQESGEEKTLGAPIPNEEARVINSAGINNCGGMCIVRPEVQDGCMLSIGSDCSSNDPHIRACVRGRGYRKTFLSPGRLRYPMKRIGERGSGKFERITWDEAADLIAKEWRRIRDQYGPSSSYVNYATGVTGIMRPGTLVRRLLSMDGGYLEYFNSYSSACSGYISPYIFGTRACGNSPQDMLNTKLLVLWGDNPVETIFGTERNHYLALAKQRGIRIIVVDPRLSNTAVAYADQWIGIRPTTDAALADAMAYVIWSEGLHNQHFMDTYCVGFDEEHMPEGVPAGESYHTYLFGKKDGIPKTPEWAAEITGIDAETIRTFAREYAKAKPACIIMGLGPQRHGNGEQTTKGISALTCLTGNVGISGGGAAANGDIVEHEKITLYNNTVKNPYPGKIPVFLWTKAIEHGTEMTPRGDRLTGVEKLDSNLRLMFNLAGNILINQHSDINDSIRILKDDTKCQFVLCSDVFMTPSARFADVLLPGTSVFEGNNIVPPWRGNNYVLRNNKVIEPLFGCRFEWEWLKEVADRLGYYEEFIDGKPDMEDWLIENYNVLREKEPELPDYETFCERGGWQYKEPITYIAFEKEIADPEHHPFATPSGKIEIFSKDLYDFEQEDIPAIPRYLPCPEGPEDPIRETYPLQLIGWHTRRRCHSIHDNNEWQDEVEMPGLWIHPEDAKARGISDGDMVETYNDRGCVKIPAVITERIIRGVVAMTQGGWYTPDKNGVDIRGSINVLTSAKHASPLAKGNPQHTNLVEVKKA
ncbi:MAG: molybdopterin-dependent oxidoreductase [Lachnospiraceae bacterium]|nr:molybdopterin-dependent oxidoreductase [Lachnospiraceae bacterium]